MNGEKVLNSFFWRLFERCGAQGVTFIVSIVLARILDPEAYGKLALVIVFTSILQVFVDSGMGNALIQKKNADDIDFSTVFYFNIVGCLVLYSLLFVLAPIIADFYKMPDLTAVIRVLGLTLIISGVKNVQQAYVSRNMLFKRFFFATIGGTIVAAGIGIGLAVAGFGVWALVIQHITNLLIDTVILWITVRWRPRKVFSFKRLKTLFSYGWKLLVSALLDTGYNQMRSLIIGKLYSSDDLAFYNKGQQFPNLIISNVNTSIDSVLLPSMATEQESIVRVKAMMKRSIGISTYIIIPMMVGLFVCAKPLVVSVLTDKWISCVPYLQVFSICYAIYPIHTANLNAMKAIGRSDMFLRIEIIKKCVGISALLISMRFGVFAIAISYLVEVYISQFINAFPNKKLVGYGYFEQIKDILPQTIIACVMGGIVYLWNFIELNSIIILVLQMITGVTVYIGLSRLFRLQNYTYLVDKAKQFLNKRKRNKEDLGG